MNKPFLVLGLLGVGACTQESSPTIEAYAPDGARIVRSATTNPLTTVSTADQTSIVREFLRDRYGAAVEQIKQTTATPTRDGITHVRFEQRINGLRVYGGYAKAAFSPDGELLQVIDRLADIPLVTHAAVLPGDALVTKCNDMGWQVATPTVTRTAGNVDTFDRDPRLAEDPTVEKVVYMDAGVLREGFVVTTWTLKTNQLDETLIGADGQIVSVNHRTAADAYNVFIEDPDKGGQVVVNGPAPGGTESPNGWLGAGAQSSQNINGNNVSAYLDTDANNAPDALAGSSTVTDGNFLSVADLTVTPGTVGNRNVAVQNLFFLNNTIHDVLYRHGFDEAAGNFQVDNFGRGGLAGDPVNAEAQDGSGLDNANFATPADGSRPRMQMFLWSGTDGDAFVTVGGVDRKAFSSGFGAAVSIGGVTGPLAIANDGTGVTSDACEAMPRNSLAGAVAIVDRGTCNFTVKVLNAQTAGAIAVIIANNVAGNAFSPGGTERRVKISSAMVSLDDGTALKGLVGQAATLRQNPSPLRLDGDVDADVVFHEYGHGLTQRMIGNMSGAIAGAIGEGASDVNALYNDSNDVIGEYVFAFAGGIRSQPYANYQGSYATSVTGTEVHADGELYAAIMFRVRVNYLASGLSNDDVYDDWVNGMNFTPSGPAYENMRDGMLQGLGANTAARECFIWEAFAHYGVGVGATGKVRGKGVQITESFTVPPQCAP